MCPSQEVERLCSLHEMSVSRIGRGKRNTGYNIGKQAEDGY